ncbi:MAG: SRPBCC domain-containing protein [Kofleriaceae bacterium]
MTARIKRAASAVADTTDGIVLARVEIAAPPERVWAAITTDELTKWWGSPAMYTTTKHTTDLRAGGAWRSEGRGADGSDFHVGGEVLEVDPPRRLVQTWKPSWEQGPATKVTWTLEAIDGGTRVTVRHTGFTDPRACGDHANGWERVLGWLGGHLAATEDARYFLARLIAPRPSFMQDQTAEEREAMGAHLAYLQAQLAAGTVVFFGPVADAGGPHGGWGLVILRAADEAAARAVGDGDPIVQSGRGFRYEVLPILRAYF